MRHIRAAALPFSVRLGGPHPLAFGVRRPRLLRAADKIPGAWRNDFRLFAGAYTLGFAAVSLFIA